MTEFDDSTVPTQVRKTLTSPFWAETAKTGIGAARAWAISCARRTLQILSSANETHKSAKMPRATPTKRRIAF
jgi:hypothetical protein